MVGTSLNIVEPDAWPIGWASWPDEIEARKEWLKVEAHLNFEPWRHFKSSEGTKFADLEEAIRKITGQKKWFEEGRTACEEVWALRKPGDTSRARSKESKEVGIDTARRMLAACNVEWKEELTPWLLGAMEVLGGRTVALWKQHMQHIKKGEDDGDSIHTISTSTKSKATTITTAPSTPRKNKASTQSPPTSALKKVRLDEAGNKKEVRWENDQHLQQFGISTKTMVLIERSLVICLSEDIPSENDYVKIGIAAIVMDNYELRGGVDIRAEHLSWEKLKQMLIDTEGDYIVGGNDLYDADDTMKLSYDDEQGDCKEIQDEIDFHNAVGNLEWYARYGSKGPHLMMRLSIR